jgi:hypothetical protein
MTETPHAMEPKVLHHVVCLKLQREYPCQDNQKLKGQGMDGESQHLQDDYFERLMGVPNPLHTTLVAWGNLSPAFFSLEISSEALPHPSSGPRHAGFQFEAL